MTTPGLRGSTLSDNLSEKELTLNPGDSAQLTVTLDPENAADVQLVWTSSDEEVAIVDEAGKVTALAIGEAVIRVADADNPEIFAECLVKVSIETGVDEVVDERYVVRSVGRSIYVSGLTGCSDVYLYSADAVLILHEICNEGSFKVDLPSNGVYLLVVDGIKYKMLVK